MDIRRGLRIPVYEPAETDASELARGIEQAGYEAARPAEV